MTLDELIAVGLEKILLGAATFEVGRDLIMTTRDSMSVDDLVALEIDGMGLRLSAAVAASRRSKPAEPVDPPPSIVLPPPDTWAALYRPAVPAVKRPVVVTREERQRLREEAERAKQERRDINAARLIEAEERRAEWRARVTRAGLDPATEPSRYDLQKAELGMALDNFASDRAREMLKSITLQAEDGSQRNLFDFTTADVDKWERMSDKRSKSWAARAEWFRDVRAALNEYDVQTIGGLPGEYADQFADRAEALWKSEAAAAA